MPNLSLYRTGKSLAEHEILRIQVVRTVPAHAFSSSHFTQRPIFSHECSLTLIPFDLLTTATTCNIFMVRYSPTYPIVLSEVRILLGVAASTARPFSPPTAFRITPRHRPGKLERTQMLEGRCHRCTRWVPVQGVKDADAKVLSLPNLSDELLNSGAGMQRLRNFSGK
jgi:hypothetical protein